MQKLRQINTDGTALVETEDGGVEAVQLVIGRSGYIGVIQAEMQDALGLDQVGAAPPPSTPPEKSSSSKGHFDISGIDQA